MQENVFLVTGASGFIGGSLVKRILKDFPEVRLVLLSRTSSFQEFSECEKISSVIGDTDDVELLSHLLKTYRVTHIYHLAAEAIISEYSKNPRKAYLSTIYGTTSLLEAVRISGGLVQKVIVSTSYKVYGDAEAPYNEETKFSPTNTYETAKVCQDLIAQDYFRTFKVPVVIFRSVNVYGPGDKNMTRLVPRSFSNIYNNIPPVVYSYAKDSLREFIYIDDLIDAMLILQEKAEPGSIYCIGGVQASIYEVVKTICEVAGCGDITIVDAGNISETKEHMLDSSKITKLGWKKKISLKEGLEKSSHYYKTMLTKL